MISDIKVSKMKKKDLVIVSHLRKNAREVLANISRRSGFPISTIHDRIKSNAGGLIEKYSALLDYQELGFHARANVILKVAKKDKEQLREYLEKHQNINNLYKINNGYDFMFEAVFRNLIELEAFLEKIEDKFEILNRESYYIMGNIKREGFMADPKLIEVTIPY